MTGFNFRWNTLEAWRRWKWPEINISFWFNCYIYLYSLYFLQKTNVNVNKVPWSEPKKIKPSLVIMILYLNLLVEDFNVKSMPIKVYRFFQLWIDITAAILNLMTAILEDSYIHKLVIWIIIKLEDKKIGDHYLKI